MIREPKFETSLPDFVITKRKIFCVIFSLHEYEITLMLCTKICIFHKIIQNTKKDIYIYIYISIYIVWVYHRIIFWSSKIGGFEPWTSFRNIKNYQLNYKILSIYYLIWFSYINISFFKREILTNTLKVLVNNSFKENFYEKRKKQLMF